MAKVDSFELGFKSTFWDRRIQFNATGFFQIDTDAQVQFNQITAAGDRENKLGFRQVR